MDKQTINTILEKKLEEMNLFLVELHISADNVITVFADGMENISVEQCTAIARYLRSELGEAADDFEITASSPGLDKPFRHINQYLKNVGKSVEIVTLEGSKIEGKINQVTVDEIVLRTYKKKNTKNKTLKPQLSEQLVTVNMNNIKQTKKLIII